MGPFLKDLNRKILLKISEHFSWNYNSNILGSKVWERQLN